jgi:SNF2 family DNA or RNA helicase
MMRVTQVLWIVVSVACTNRAGSADHTDRGAIEAAYRAQDDAITRNDSEAFIRTPGPDYMVFLRNGVQLTREQATMYQAVVDDLLANAQAAEGMKRRGLVLAALTRLKQICNHPAHATGDGSRIVGRSGKLARFDEPPDDLLDAVKENGEWLGERLETIARKSPKVRAVRGMGFMWGIDVVEPASNIVQRGWDAGLLIITAGDHTLRLLPPLVIERADLERSIQILESILS